MEVRTNTLNKKGWKQFTLVNNNGISIKLLNYGGIITGIYTPDKHGNIENIVLGYHDYEEYSDNPNYFGAIIGRVAGRIQNSSFALGENKFTLDSNEGKHHLHGGKNGFHHVIWDDEVFETDSSIGVKLKHKSLKSANSYPGNLTINVTYTLDNDNEFTIDYNAITDEKTAITLTNHTYFNLNGDLKDTIHNHNVMMDSSRFIELDNELIPTGECLNVKNSSFDFRNGKFLASGINNPEIQNKFAKNGYDHFFILDKRKKNDAIIKEYTSGRILSIQTNQPGIVLYTGNNIEDNINLHEGNSKKYLGVTFEAQSSPASLHHKGFPSIILNPDETYKQQTKFKFELETST